MKRILFGLLTAALMIAIPLSIAADTLPEPDTTEPSGSEGKKVIIVASEDDLPDGYVVDDSFIMEFEMDSESNWSRNLTEMLEQYAGDDYVYYFLEKDIPKGYYAAYYLDSTVYTDGNIIIIKNIREGKGPSYLLPSTGGSGTTVYTVAGVSILLTAAVYGLILYKKRKKSLEEQA